MEDYTLSETTIETVYSNLMVTGVLSEEEPDFRFINGFRITEDNQVRETENDELRTLE